MKQPSSKLNVVYYQEKEEIYDEAYFVKSSSPSPTGGGGSAARCIISEAQQTKFLVKIFLGPEVGSGSWFSRSMPFDSGSFAQLTYDVYFNGVGS